jgi:HD-GYP domain-containing protein (c-di-GMP phosphodiesterase class II)
METKLENYLSVAEKVTQEITDLSKPKQVPGFVAEKISQAIGSDVQYAYIDLTSNTIYESSTLDRTVKHILPFFLEKRFIEEMKKLDWSVIDPRGVRFLIEKMGGQNLELDASFLILPKRRGDFVSNFSVFWGGKALERVDKEEITLISIVCGAVELRMNTLLAYQNEKGSEGRELRRKAFELRELAGIGVDLTSLGKEDFFGSFLLNVMGRALSKTAAIVLSTNENNTEYGVVSSRGVYKKNLEKIHFTDRSTVLMEMRRKREPILLTEIAEQLAAGEREDLEKFEAQTLVPLILKNSIVGFLTLGERMNLQPYSEKIFDSIKLICNQMVMAIENSKLSNLRYAFSRYVPHQLVDGILSDPEKIRLGGERRKVTALFADIRGFTSMAERMRPEDVVDLLNTYLSGLTDVVFKYEGTLDKYIGDGVMAVFGAPISHYNDTERAVITAIEMQGYIGEVNKKREDEGLEKVEIGIGVHTGYVISGNMGSIDRMNFTVIGDAVNTAARLEALAGRGQILITKEVYDEVKYLVEAQFLNTIAVKGKEKQVSVFQVKDLIARKYLNAVEKREPYIIGHFLSIAQDAEAIGKHLGFSGEELVKLRASSMLIDVGRIGLNEAIFHKTEKLSPAEFEVVKSHVLRGAEYVEKKLHLFKEGVELVRHHHESWDGSGYPDGLRGEGIPLWARIVCVVDTFQALISRRPFREAFSEEEAMGMLKEGRGKKFDPKIVDVYLQILKERITEREEKER